MLPQTVSSSISCQAAQQFVLAVDIILLRLVVFMTPKISSSLPYVKLYYLTVLTF
jgi:hypothetical protein